MAREQVLTHHEGAAEAAPSKPSAAGGLELRSLTKRFGEEVVAVDAIDLHIQHGEYVVLLGASGCGKTTTLRMIGGHEEPTSGDIVMDGQSLLGLPPDKRPTTTVFQHFALFPHRSVRENVEFGLKMHGIGKEARRERAREALEMVGLGEMADRKPSALSGGQQQRVALARVLVMEPKALLLDEPLGDLDRLLRLRMRVELRSLQRQTGLMFIHVTHDQEEALSVADRVVVMHDGRIEQMADPYTISTRPENVRVATFMGDNNIFHGTVASRDGERLRLEGEDVEIDVRAPADGFEVGRPAAVSVRAAAIQVQTDAAAAEGPNQIAGSIDVVEYLGDLVKLHLSAGGKRLLAKVSGDRYPEFQGREGSTVRLSWKEEDVQPLRA
ncbi:MAG TPA: ABC transporter ATP-binding protein [Gaiellaceae bacterium]|nr:ABC transporter ATP-binding protein [Gaiellaceae bacterium]